MSTFVNGTKQKDAAALQFPPMLPGETSIGVRLNRVSWFKGCIAEIRFVIPPLLPLTHSSALGAMG
jgi:hypothetical protein